MIPELDGLDAGGQRKSFGVLQSWYGVRTVHPEGIVPFTDDTGGNKLAFDIRAGPAPSIMFVDHELPGEAGLRPVPPDLAALLRLLS